MGAGLFFSSFWVCIRPGACSGGLREGNPLPTAPNPHQHLALPPASVALCRQAAYARAKHVLRQHERELHALAQELIDKETLTGAQIKELLTRVKAGKAGGGTAAPAS